MWWWRWAGHCFIFSCLFLIHIFLHMSGGKGVSVRISSLFACKQTNRFIHGVATDEQEILFIFSPTAWWMCSGISGGKKQGGSLSSELMLDADSQKHSNNDVCCKKKTRLKCIFFFKEKFCFLVFFSKFRYLILKQWKNLDLFFFIRLMQHYFTFSTYFVIFWIIGLHGSKDILRASYQGNMMFFFFKYHSQSLPTSSEQDQRNTMFSTCWTRAAAFEQTAHSKIQRPQNRQQDAPGWGNPSGRWILVHGIQRDTEKAVRWLWLVALKVMNELFTRRQVRTLGV